MGKLKSLMCAAALLPLGLFAAPARADTIHLHTTDGPMRIWISPDGEVHGEYPKRQGEIRGHLDPDGGIHGVWLQPRSDHPCNHMRSDTYAWGAFYISNPYRHNVVGYWGYCGEEPRRDWEVERD